MNFYKRHIGDYIKDAGHLTLLEHGVYTRLLDVYYTRESGIPQDKAARLIGARSKDELQALANVLEEFFTVADGTWTQGRCEEEISNASDKATKNRENGAKGGRPRKTEPKENPNGFDFVNHVGSENNLSQTPDSRLQTKTLEPPPPASNEVGPTQAEGVSASRIGEICIFLRTFGINTSPNALTGHEWTSHPDATNDLLTSAVATAKAAKPNQPIHVNYLKPIIERLLNPPAPKAAAGEDWTWKKSNQGIEAKAKELGIRAHGTMSYHDLADKCQTEINRRKGAKP